MGRRGIAAITLAIPVAAGLAYLQIFGAPARYLAINAAALLTSIVIIAVMPKIGVMTRRVLIAILLAVLFVPLLTGPSVSGVARWLPVGPFQPHAGMLAIPLLAVLCAEEPDHAPAVLSLALFATLLQPDMASAAALMLAAVGLCDATRDWRYAAFSVVAFVVALVAAMRGELPAQPFVEHVIFAVARTDPLAALALLAALVISFYLMAGAVHGSQPSRKALAGSLFGFSFAGLVSNYPSALIGYGAAPILGYGLALAAQRPRGA